MDDLLDIVIGQVWICDRDGANIEILAVGELPCLDGQIREFIKLKISHKDTYRPVMSTSTKQNFIDLIGRENLYLIGNAKLS